MRDNEGKIKIINALQINRQAWQDYVDHHTYGTVFHTSYVFDVYNSTPHYKPFAFFVVNEDGEIEAMMSGFLQTVKPGALAKLSTRSVLLQGPIYTTIDSLEPLLGFYYQWIKGKALYTEVRNHYLDAEYSKHMQSAGFQWEGHYNIMREIPSTTEQLWKEIGRKRKDGINKAKRFDFQVSEDNSIGTVTDFYDLLTRNYSQLRLPIPKRVFFDNCVFQDASGYCRFFKLEDDGVTKVVLLAFLFHGILHAVYIGSDQDHEFISKRPIDYFYFAVMRWCVENNVRYFDWLGAGKPNVSYGVRDFKLQYGGELVDFGRFNMVHSPLGFKIAETGFRLIQKLKGKI
ncbi:MAG: hypothetical protein CVU50_03065 [Candidatus Cloacimonetes bacterium HGW-Cloacimonetes-3]|jgi:hypothetical protein|nr:MAG: hypothetical protein CVU50_03065 [Candidatus Cloacimonetes bacterium HGW-Cloacimonetes-3]